MGDKVLLSTQNLDITSDKKFVPCFVGPFPIVQQVGPLGYQLNLGTHYI